MESRSDRIGTIFKKKRSHIPRPPRPKSQPLSNERDIPSLSSSPSSNHVKAGTSDEISGRGHISRGKELSLSPCGSSFPGASVLDGEKHRKNYKEDIRLNDLYCNSGPRDSSEQGHSGSNHIRSRECVLALEDWKITNRAKESSKQQKAMTLNRKKGDITVPSPDVLGNNTKLKRLKLKVGGSTRTIDGNSKSSYVEIVTVTRQKSAHKDNSESKSSPSRDKKGGLQGIPWKDFSKSGFTFGRDESTMKGVRKNGSVKQSDKFDSAQKNKQISKKRVSDGFDDYEDDDEIRYMKKLKIAKCYVGFGKDDENPSRKHQMSSGNIPLNTAADASLRLGKDGKKRSPSDGTDYEEEEEPASSRKEPVDALVEPPQEITLTRRQRALQAGRNASRAGVSVLEFPNGLPLGPSKKKKTQLSEVDQQLQKAEAAQRRKLQNEKAAKELLDETIRKILGQDSTRKKREDNKKKRAAELAKKKAADEIWHASHCIRVSMGPEVTTVTFPEGLPGFFDSKPHGYPPARGKCVVASCNNPYKYRDSKTKLPICSLECYKAVQANERSKLASC